MTARTPPAGKVESALAAAPGAPARVVCVALSPSIDVTYVVPKLDPGTIHRMHEVYRVPGGKGFNVARAAHTLGADVVATGVLGGDSGAWLLAMLARSGIRLAPVAGNQPTRTCVSIADRSAANLTEFYEPPPRITPKAWADLVNTVARLCKQQPSWVSLSGSLPPGPAPESLAELVAAAKGAGAKVAVDTHSTALAAAVGAGADLVKVNVQEAAAVLASQPGSGSAHQVTLAPAALAAQLLATSPSTDLAIVTAGADGAVAACRDGRRVQVRLEVRGDYPIGSGDSFLGGLLTVLAHGQQGQHDLDAALRLAAGAGAANALTPGAGVFDPESARQLAEKVVLTDL